MSGLYFWTKAKRNTALRRETADHPDLSKLLRLPGNVSVADMRTLLRLIFPLKADPVGALRRGGGPLLEYSYVLGGRAFRSPRARSRSPRSSGGGANGSATAEEAGGAASVVVAEACESLRRDMTVGITEQMDSFAVLVSSRDR